MTPPAEDKRSVQRRSADERIAAEPKLPPPVLAPNAVPAPMETHMGQRRRPVAVAGVVENGLVRPLDSKIKLPENARVIIVAADDQ